MGEQLDLQVFPPRLPRAAYLGLRVAPEGRPRPFPAATQPDDARIASIAPHADVFALHAYFCKEEDPRELARFDRRYGPGLNRLAACERDGLGEAARPASP